MGIRFACHHCNHALHLKDFQAGKRGKCPACNQSFRIPQHTTDYSIPLEEKGAQNTTSTPAVIVQASQTKASPAGVSPAGVSPASAGSLKVGASSTRGNKSEPRKTVKLDERVAVADRSEAKIRKPDFATSANTSSSPKLAGDETARGQDLTEASTNRKSGMVKAFESNPLAQWYVRPPSGGQYGPADSKLLAQWIAENRVTADSLIWFDGLTQWTAAGSVLPELFNSLSEPPNTDMEIRSTSDSSYEAVLELNTTSRPVNTSAIQSVSKPIRARQKQKRNQWIVIAVLVSVCLCLLVGLVAVLMLKK